MTTAKPKSIKCGCCQDPVKASDAPKLFKDPDMGFVCPECQYRLKIVIAWLKHYKISGCAYLDERGKAL